MVSVHEVHSKTICWLLMKISRCPHLFDSQEKNVPLLCSFIKWFFTCRNNHRLYKTVQMRKCFGVKFSICIHNVLNRTICHSRLFYTFLLFCTLFKIGRLDAHTSQTDAHLCTSQTDAHLCTSQTDAHLCTSQTDAHLYIEIYSSIWKILNLHFVHKMKLRDGLNITKSQLCAWERFSWCYMKPVSFPSSKRAL
jgi:hypothetical protein